MDPNKAFIHKKAGVASVSNELRFSKDITITITCVGCYFTTKVFISAGIGVTLSAFQCNQCKGNKWGWRKL